MALSLPFDWLADAVPSIAGRIAVTVGLLAALVGAGWLVRAAIRRVEARVDRARYIRIATTALGVGLATATAAATEALVGLWEQTAAVSSTLGRIGDPTAVAGQFALTFALIVGTYLVTGVVKEFVFEFAEGRTAISRHQTELAFRVTQVSLYALAIVVAFGIWRVNLGGLLVGAGFLGIVVGMAARQTLGALVAGFVLMFSRPFEIGDWVAIGDREGIVTEISIVNTRIQTFDGEYAMIPNDVVSSNEIINRTRKGRLRLHVEVGVDYGADVPRAVEVAAEAMHDVEEILTVPQPQVVAKEFGASAVVLDLRFWIDKPSARRKWRAQTAVITAVKRAFDREGIKIPFPQRELMGRPEEGGFRVAGEGTPEMEVTPDGGPDEE